MALLNLFHRIFKSDDKQNALVQKPVNLGLDDKKFIEIIQKLSEERPFATVSYYDRNESYFYHIENSSMGPVMLSYSEYLVEEDDYPYVQIQVPELKYNHYAFDRGVFDKIAFNKGRDFIKNKLKKSKSLLTPYEMLAKSVDFMDPKEKQIAREEQYLKARVIYSVIKNLINKNTNITVKIDKKGSRFSLFNKEKKFMTFEFINETKYQSVKISIPSIHMSGVFQDMSGTSDEFIFNIAKRYLDYLSGKTSASNIMTNTYHLQNPESMFSFNDEKYITTIAKVYQSLNQEKRKTRSTRTR